MVEGVGLGGFRAFSFGFWGLGGCGVLRHLFFPRVLGFRVWRVSGFGTF